ncbi:MAG: hypothetical protein Q8P19_00835, partial [bacterium]|nr:hypothetical protein [bacterium]
SYLHAVQESDGGFGDVSATSWVLQAATALGQSAFDWSAGTYEMPDYYLATQQELDGGIGPMSDNMEKRIWATSYAVPAIERRTWDSLLAHFPKATSTPLVLGASTSTAATTTASAAFAVAAPAAPAATPVCPQPKPVINAGEPGTDSHAFTPVKTQTAAAADTSPFSWAREALSILLPWFF